ncbi:hypothetical protein [Natrinema sp. DC36]|uniref:hypothetical protein n=1 Tax=Natrinema sp. DC36 TaxID=2878680 RepID=UPI001CF00446|nr:hypothetical protein [Natrinema sp. DC36]
MELFFFVGIWWRGGFNQLGYYWITSYKPNCKTTRELTTDVPVVLEDIKPWAVYVVHLFPPFCVVCGIAFVYFAFPLQFHGVSSWVELVSLAGVTLQVVFVMLWDPLVLLVKGPAQRANERPERDRRPTGVTSQ